MPNTDRMRFAEEFEPGFTGTTQEHVWIKQSLGGFWEDRWFSDILYRVKAGKEATVYCCRADESTGRELIAAKVYRPRMFRAMRNDWLYRQGREMLDADGKAIRDDRGLRAIRKGTRFGKRLKTVSWNQNELATMHALHQAGADVPEPLAGCENAILMEYMGDDVQAAPVLQRVRLGRREAEALFERLMRNVEVFLACNRIHADLSAYNVLYWAGEAKVIDFPQAVEAHSHPRGFFLLSRDVDRLCRYFARQGVQRNAVRIAHELWERFLAAEL